MKDYQRLQHTLWECKYRVVFIPKYRRKVLFAASRKELGPVFRELARRQGFHRVRIEMIVMVVGNYCERRIWNR